MSATWDRRQAVAALGSLRRAARQTEFLIERLDDGREAGLRAGFALRFADDAVRDLGRFYRRKERERVAR